MIEAMPDRQQAMLPVDTQSDDPVQLGLNPPLRQVPRGGTSGPGVDRVACANQGGGRRLQRPCTVAKPRPRTRTGCPRHRTEPHDLTSGSRLRA